ncbi:O-antigen ligase family protein [Plesiomonas shigelloides subsp. oncorhynchi]|nr:O-antigen ligase family protein [Plesiomonas shigelloides]
MLLFSLAAMVLLVLFAVAGISDRSSGGAAEEGIDASAMGRLYAWEAAWGMALAHPFRGVGLNNFYYNYYFYSPHWDGLNHAVHSTWFNVLSETGFLGFAVFMLMLLTTLFHVWRVALKLDSSEPYPWPLPSMVWQPVWWAFVSRAPFNARFYLAGVFAIGLVGGRDPRHRKACCR